MMRERVSLATYLAARPTLLYKAICYRQWARSDPDKAQHYGEHLRTTQRQLAMLRAAERMPSPHAMPSHKLKVNPMPSEIQTAEVWAEEPDCRVRVEPWGGGTILTISTPWLPNPIVVSVADYRWKRIVAATTDPIDLPKRSVETVGDALKIMDENDRFRKTIAQAVLLIDRAMGDTDPQDPDHPLLLACQMLAREVQNV